MIKHIIKLMTAVTLVGFASTATATADDHEIIESVMKNGMKGKNALVAKVKSGKGSKADIKKLHDMFVKLAKTKPEKGEMDSWKAKTSALVNATGLLVKGDKKGLGALKKASNCKACHNLHK